MGSALWLFLAFVAATIASKLLSFLVDRAAEAAGEDPRIKRLSRGRQITVAAILFVIFASPAAYQGLKKVGVFERSAPHEQSELRVISVDPAPGTPLSAGALASGLRFTAVVESAIVGTRDWRAKGFRPQLVVNALTGRTPSDDTSWHVLASREIDPERTQHGITALLSLNDVWHDEITVELKIEFVRPGTNISDAGYRSITQVKYPVAK